MAMDCGLSRRVASKYRHPAEGDRTLSLANSQTPFVFTRRDAGVRPGSGPKGSKQIASLELKLKPDANSVDDSRLQFSDASLRTRLLGGEVFLRGGTVTIEANGLLKAIFEAPTAADGDVKVDKVEVRLTAGALEVELFGLTMSITLSGTATSSRLRIFAASPEGDYHWLGAELERATAGPMAQSAPDDLQIDHARGVVTVALAAGRTMRGDLVRGMSFEGARARGHVAMTLAAPMPSWPAAKLAAAWLDLQGRLDDAEGKKVLASRQRVSISGTKWEGPGLELDLTPVSRRSRVRWPVDALDWPERDQAFVAGGRAVTVAWQAAGEVCTHQVELELLGHPLPATLLASDGDTVTLTKPWRFLARARHAIGGLHWTSVEAVTAIDHHDLLDLAAEDAEPDSDDQAFEFSPHYRSGQYRAEAVRPYMRNPGVARRALAAAGLPDLVLARALRDALQPSVGTAPASALILLGGAAHIVQTGVGADKEPIGVQLTLPWVSSWADQPGAPVALNSPLDNLQEPPQVAATLRVSDIDLAAGQPFELSGDRGPSVSLPARADLLARNLASVLAEPWVSAPPPPLVPWAAEQVYFESATALEVADTAVLPAQPSRLALRAQSNAGRCGGRAGQCPRAAAGIPKRR